MFRTAMWLSAAVVLALMTTGYTDSTSNNAHAQPQWTPQQSLAARSPNSRLFVGPFGSIASVVSSLGSVGVLGIFLLFLVFLPYIVNLIIIPLLTSNQGRSLGDSPYETNKRRIVETMNFLEEVWKKFDAKDPECQKSMLCQLHVEEENLGYLGKRAAKAISYLTFLDAIELPKSLKSMISGYTMAIRQGREHKTCPYQCPFSLTDTLKKMNEPNVQ